MNINLLIKKKISLGHPKTYPIKSVPVRISGTMKKALYQYQRFHIPKQVLLRDYLAVVNYKDHLQIAENPWLYYHKGILREDVEAGMSAMETAFEFGAMELRKTKPTDVIRAVFYSTRNDSGVELSYIYPLIESKLTSEAMAVIVNPSPDFILKVEESRDTRFICAYVLRDETLAKLYSIEFPNVKFYSMDEMPFEHYDYALYFNRDASNEEEQKFRKWFLKASSGILMYPNKFIDNREYRFYEDCIAAGLAIRRIEILDPKATMTIPRKKSVIFFNTIAQQDEANKESASFTLANTKYDKHTLAFHSDEYKIDASFFEKASLSVIQLWNAATKYDQHKEDVAPPKYGKSKTFIFSKEIKLKYGTYIDHGSPSATIWYCTLIDAERDEYGKRITKILHRGLNPEKAEEFSKSMNQIAFDDNLYPYIRADVEREFIRKNRQVTIKTLWYLCRDTMLGISRYEDGVFSNLFLEKENGFSNYFPMSGSVDDLTIQLGHALECDEEEIPVKIFRQFELFFETARKLQYLLSNPLTPYMSSFSNRATKRQQQIRDVLTKKHLERDEEMKIFTFLIADVTVKGKKYLKCVAQSLWLIPVIRLFTGMALRECCALEWTDYISIGDGEYQFSVNKFVDEKGKIRSHIERENWVRFRLVPCARPLAYILNKRIEYLKERGIDATKSPNLPIIQEMEGRKHYCRPSKGAEYCRKAIAKAEIPENIIILPDEKNELATNIYKYNGDLFLSNLRMHLNHECGFELGEINYMIGIAPPDTFSKHYCDYSNSLVQSMMIQKMNRWTNIYEFRLKHLTIKKPEMHLEISDNEHIVSGPYRDQCSQIEILLKTKSEKAEIELTVEAKNGYKISIERYKQEGNS